MTDIVITPEVVRQVLSCDAYCRKTRFWPLIEMAESEGVKVSYDPSLVVAGHYAERQVAAFPNLTKVNTLIDKHFPCTREMLAKYAGNLFLCGGAVCHALHGGYSRSNMDADFFLVGIDEARATQILQGCIDFISKSSYKASIIRNVNTTTVFARTSSNESRGKYQFIHRIYERLDLVIGGFDLHYSAVAFDGQNIFFTPAAYFSHCTQTMILDVARRSPSFESRIEKYQGRYGLTIIVPGLARHSILKHSPQTFAKWGDFRMPYLTLGGNGNGQAQFNGIRRAVRGKSEMVSDYGEIVVGDSERQAKANNRYAMIGKVDLICTFNFTKNSKAARLEEHSVPGGAYQKIEEFIKYVKSKDFRDLKLIFGEDNAKMLLTCLQERHYDPVKSFLRDLNAKIDTNIGKARQVLSKIAWMTHNPGAQWTSSLNPISESPRLWYGPAWVPFGIMIPSGVETCVRLMRLRKGSVWNLVPRDVLNIILRDVAEFYAHEGLQACTLGHKVRVFGGLTAMNMIEYQARKIANIMKSDPNLMLAVQKLLAK